MQSSYGETTYNKKDFLPMHILYLTQAVKPWFPGISYKYSDSNTSIKNAMLIRCTNI